MKITDKYILGRFLKILSLALLTFILVVIIVDIIENVDKFIDNDATTGLIVQYYIYYIPFIVVLALPVATLLATMFTIGSLARYHELEVMKATGLSLYRLGLPILTAGFVISILVIVFSDFILVPANAEKDRIKNEEIFKKQARRNLIRNDVIKAAQDGWVVFAETYNELGQTGNDILINRIVENNVKTAIRAESMIWKDSQWVLTMVSQRDFEGQEEKSYHYFDTLYASFLPHTPEIMAHQMKKPRDTRFFELKRNIQLKKWMGQETAKDLVELYLKVSFPFINFIIIILGIPLAANPRRSGSSVGFGLSIIISFMFFVLVRAGQSLGSNNHLPPILAATIGNLIFLVIGTVMFLKARK